MELMTLERRLFLKKSPAQMRWMRHAGTWPKSAKVGGRVMFRKADVIAWVDAQFDQAEAG